MKKNYYVNEIVVLDFETTGLRNTQDRTIEVGAVLFSKNQVVDTFSQLMNPGEFLPHFITQLTGITDHMLSDQPSPEKVMPQLKKFIGDRVLLAHNAHFDYGFLKAEMNRVKIEINNPILCSLKLARRLVANSKSHKLTDLASHFNIDTGKAHRALDDALVTAHVWRELQELVQNKIGSAPNDFSFYHQLSSLSLRKLNKFFEKPLTEI